MGLQSFFAVTPLDCFRVFVCLFVLISVDSDDAILQWRSARKRKRCQPTRKGQCGTLGFTPIYF